MKPLCPFLALFLLATCPDLAADSPASAPAATAGNTTAAATTAPDQVAAKPLFRDPVYDGAADPTIIYHPDDKKWYMFYTNRRANVPGLNGVAWVHGTPIGIATSADGASWQYLGQAKINYKDAVPDATWWAPAVVEDHGLYHMYLVYVPGTFSDGWNHPRYIIHLTSKDLLTWDYQSTLPLAHPKVIDPGVLHLPDGTWRLWYKDEATGSSCDYADSQDLNTWVDHGRVPGLSDRGGEAPLAFHWKGHYWFLRDITSRPNGLALYRSDDALNWTRVGTLLQTPGTGPDDKAVGHHPEVILSDDRAYLFYFTQPDSTRGSAVEGNARRSSIQVTELHYDATNNTLTCDRNAPTLINLQPPADPEKESKFD
ncbi:MAG: glycosyl hydrolase [Opitutales bacterium]|jgi:beta-xylosidase